MSLQKSIEKILNDISPDKKPDIIAGFRVRGDIALLTIDNIILLLTQQLVQLRTVRNSISQYDKQLGIIEPPEASILAAIQAVRDSPENAGLSDDDIRALIGL
jgi:hypothetical protein